MAVSPTYPGVYIEELPSGVHTIIGVATSITAFVGRTKSGPANKGVTLTTFGDYERTFGGLDADFPVSYAVSDFFAAGGGVAIVVRLFHDAGAAAAQEVAAAADASNDPDPAKVADAAHTKAGTFTQEPEKSAAAGVDKAAADAAAKPGATPQNVKDAAADAAGAVHDTSSASWVPNDSFGLKATGPGEWGNKLYVSVDKDGITDEVGKRYGLSSGGPLFNLSVFYDPPLDANGAPLAVPPDERIQNVSVFDGAGGRRLDRVLATSSNLVASSVKAFIPKEADAQGNAVPIAEAELGKPKKFDGGHDSVALELEDYSGSEDDKTGFHGLDDVDLFNILCVPPDSRAGDTGAAVYDSAMKYCVGRRAILIVDPPGSWANRVLLISNPGKRLTDDIKLSGNAARNVFLYYPRLRMADPELGGAEDVFPAVRRHRRHLRPDRRPARGLDGPGRPRGLAGRRHARRCHSPIARTACSTRSPSTACARSRSSARSCGERAPCAEPTCSRTSTSTCPSGARRSSWRRASIAGRSGSCSNPTTSRCGRLIRLNVGAFMNDLFRKGAFQGTKSQDAYFVRCDSTTTTQNDIDRGVVNIIVGFAPLKPAEFVIVQLQQIAGQIQI